MSLSPSASKYWHESVLMREETQVPAKNSRMDVITVETADKASLVYSCMQTRLRGQYNGKWPISDISLVGVSKPLTTVITAIEVRLRSTEIQPTYNICSTGGRRDWWPPHQPDFPRSTTREIIIRIWCPGLSSKWKGNINLERNRNWVNGWVKLKRI